MTAHVTCPGCGGRLTLDYDPGEPMVRYYSDGSGYPGSPAYAWIEERDCECEISDELLVDLAEAALDTVGDADDGLYDNREV